jgi:hypothetical protein
MAMDAGPPSASKLPPMLAVDQWGALESGLGADWDEVELAFVAEEPGAVTESAAVLAPLGPGRIGQELRFHVRRRGGGPEKLRNLLARLDRKRIWGSLTLLRSEAAAPVEHVAARRGLVDAWDAEVATLAPGWRDLLCELVLDSSDHVPRAALLGAPLNPTRVPGRLALRFRVSDGGGYGTSPGMTRRSLERMDAEGITGTVTVLHGISDTDRAVTQGPVWRIGGRSV